MDDKSLDLVGEEISAALKGRRLGAIFSLSKFDAAFDFRLESGQFLFISVEPA